MNKTASKLIVTIILVAIVMSSLSMVASASPNTISITPVGAFGYEFICDGEYHYMPYGNYVGYGYITSGYPVKVVQAALTYIARVLVVPSCDPKGVDSLFGSNTYNAVYFFQGIQGLSRDGIVGPDTWADLAWNSASCNSRE